LKFGRLGKPRIVVLPAKLLGAIYVAVGIFLAANKDYFQNLDTAKRVLSALLAILLWPLLLLGVNLHFK
jgi:Mn2+/Fe2+ NRAMP family transporter